MHSATQLLAFQERKLGFIKMVNDKPLLISVGRSLLFYCTVVSSIGQQSSLRNLILIFVVMFLLVSSYDIHIDPIFEILTTYKTSTYYLINQLFLLLQSSNPMLT